MSDRINNLLDRNLISRDGNFYSVTNEGINHASSKDEKDIGSKRQILKSIKDFNSSQKEIFLDSLMKVNPYRFEKLISQLLEAMEYLDVTVTKQSGDKGVDVIAKSQFGITEIIELIQVKRTRNSITRPILDQLRGAAQLHDGIYKGTIITLGTFAKGCKEASTHRGATPVTLIDGDKLFELMVEHKIGITKLDAEMIEIDQNFFMSLHEDDVLT